VIAATVATWQRRTDRVPVCWSYRGRLRCPLPHSRLASSHHLNGRAMSRPIPLCASRQACVPSHSGVLLRSLPIIAGRLRHRSRHSRTPRHAGDRRVGDVTQPAPMSIRRLRQKAVLSGSGGSCATCPYWVAVEGYGPPVRDPPGPIIGVTKTELSCEELRSSMLCGEYALYLL
jgi:hypothetical protein